MNYDKNKIIVEEPKENEKGKRFSINVLISIVALQLLIIMVLVESLASANLKQVVNYEKIQEMTQNQEVDYEKIEEIIKKNLDENYVVVDKPIVDNDKPIEIPDNETIVNEEELKENAIKAKEELSEKAKQATNYLGDKFKSLIGTLDEKLNNETPQ